MNTEIYWNYVKNCPGTNLLSYPISEHLHYKVLHLSGEIDLNNSPELRQSVLSILADESALIVDFTALSYIDSSGIASLVEGLNIAKSKQLDFIIMGANGAPLQVLELTRLDTVFQLNQSIAEIVE